MKSWQCLSRLFLELVQTTEWDSKTMNAARGKGSDPEKQCYAGLATHMGCQQPPRTVFFSLSLKNNIQVLQIQRCSKREKDMSALRSFLFPNNKNTDAKQTVSMDLHTFLCQVPLHPSDQLIHTFDFCNQNHSCMTGEGACLFFPFLPHIK